MHSRATSCPRWRASCASRRLAHPEPTTSFTEPTTSLRWTRAAARARPSPPSHGNWRPTRRQTSARASSLANSKPNARPRCGRGWSGRSPESWRRSCTPTPLRWCPPRGRRRARTCSTSTRRTGLTAPMVASSTAGWTVSRPCCCPVRGFFSSSCPTMRSPPAPRISPSSTTRSPAIACPRPTLRVFVRSCWSGAGRQPPSASCAPRPPQPMPRVSPPGRWTRARYPRWARRSASPWPSIRAPVAA